MTHYERHMIMLRIMTLVAAATVLYGLACQSGPSGRAGSRQNAEEDIASADPDETPPREPYRPPVLAVTSQPEYRISDIPQRPGNVRGNLGRRPARNWKYIVIHHSGTETGSMNSFDRHARDNLGWKGVGYHFVIGNGHGTEDGLVEVTFRWEDQIHGAHAGDEEFNEYGIGICLVGNFDHTYPTKRQIEALAALTSYLQERNRIPTSGIYLHRHVKNTACPGANFPFYKFISLLRR